MIQPTLKIKKITWASAFLVITLALIYATFNYFFKREASQQREPVKEQTEAKPRLTVKNVESSAINSNTTSNSNVVANSNVTTFTVGNGSISVNSHNNTNNKTQINETKNTIIQNQHQQNNPNNAEQNSKRSGTKTSSLSDNSLYVAPPSLKTFGIDNDPDYRAYLTKVEALQNEGAELSKCSTVENCVNAYKNWQNRAMGLLGEIENFVQRKYGKKTYLAQRFGGYYLEPPAKILQEEVRVNNCRSVFFSRVELFGGMKAYVEHSFL